MDFLDEYLRLTEAKEWTKALPLIEYIVSLDSNISSSWFNYGVCLDALGRHKDAVQAFLNAYQINQDDYGAQYRAFRSLVLADDEEGFKKLLSKEIIKIPDIAYLLVSDLIFAEMLSKPDIQNIIKPYEF